MAVCKDCFRVLNYRELLFNDFGDRVALLLRVELLDPFPDCRSNDIKQEMLIVNTHLLFPHDASLCLIRLNQVIQVVQGQAAVHRCNAYIDFKEEEYPPYPAVFNDETLNSHVQRVGRLLLGPKYVKVGKKMMVGRGRGLCLLSRTNPRRHVGHWNEKRGKRISSFPLFLSRRGCSPNWCSLICSIS